MDPRNDAAASVENRTVIRGRTAEEIADSIKSAVAEGGLTAGDPLPTIRALAGDLGVNRNTVASAYRQLSDAGITEGRGRQGSRIALSAAGRGSAASSVRNLAAGNPDAGLLPPLQIMPLGPDWPHRGYEDAPADPQLADLARARFRKDGVPVGHVWIANGTFDAISMILRSVFDRPVKVGVEDPCFMTTLGLLRSLGHTAVPMAVDDNGVTPDGLARALDDGVAAVILTPRAHNPFGGSWTNTRRADLAGILARHPDVLLIEDDHFADLSLFAPQTLADEDRRNWAVVRSVSKYLGPDARLAFVDCSPALGRKVDFLGACTYRWVSGLLQRVVLQSLTSPDYDATVKRVARLYRERREGFLAALKDCGISGHGADGFNVWVPVADEQKTTRHLMEAGWIVSPGATFRLAAAPAIRVTTSALRRDQARELAALIDEIEHAAPVQRGA